MSNIILASSSPARAALLKRIGLTFTIAPPHIDETPYPNENPYEMALRLAPAKAQAVASQHPDSLIIGSDLVAVFNGQITSKPETKEQARQQLQHGSGQSAVFYTAVTLLNSATNHCQTAVEKTTVYFRNLSDNMIENYIEKDSPIGCGGSFRVESLGITLFDRIESNDPTALIGLPLMTLTKMLEKEGFHVI